MQKSAVVCLGVGLVDAMQLTVDHEGAIHDAALYARNVQRDETVVNIHVTRTRRHKRRKDMNAGETKACMPNGVKKYVTFEKDTFFTKAGEPFEVTPRCHDEEDAEKYCQCLDLVKPGEEACAGKEQNDACEFKVEHTAPLLGSSHTFKSVCWPGEEGPLRCAAHKLSTLGSCLSRPWITDENGNRHRQTIYEPIGSRCVPHESVSSWSWADRDGNSGKGEKRTVPLSYCIPDEEDATKTKCKKGYLEDGTTYSDYWPVVGEDGTVVDQGESPLTTSGTCAAAIDSLDGCAKKAEELGLVFDATKESKWPLFPFGCLTETKANGKTVLRFNSKGATENPKRSCGGKSNSGTIIKCLCG